MWHLAVLSCTLSHPLSSPHSHRGKCQWKLNCSLKEVVASGKPVCVSPARQAERAMHWNSPPWHGLCLFYEDVCVTCENTCVRILSPFFFWDGGRNRQKMNPCWNLLNPVEHQVKANPSYFLLILLSPQYKCFSARVGELECPQDPQRHGVVAPLWTGSLLRQAGFAARSRLSVFPSACVSLGTVPFTWTHPARWQWQQGGGQNWGEVFVFNGNVASTDRGSQSTVQTPAVTHSGQWYLIENVRDRGRASLAEPEQ